MTKQQRKVASRQAAITRQFYKFEREYIDQGPDVSIAQLRALAQQIWKETTKRRDQCPMIIAGNGIKQNNRLLSYCLGRYKIVLARHERRIPTLIHEITHALGPMTHGRKFVDLFFNLMDKYHYYK